MKTATVRDLRNHFAAVAKWIESGEQVTITRHGVAFALCGTDRPASVQALLNLMEDPYGRARDWATTGIGQTVSTGRKSGRP